MNHICLPLDWLSINHVLIDYGRHRVVFLKTQGEELISSQEAMREMKGEATCFVIVAQAEKKSTKEHIRRIPVVDEYADVFLDEITKLSPSRDIDFSIDLVLGVGLVVRNPV